MTVTACGGGSFSAGPDLTAGGSPPGAAGAASAGAGGAGGQPVSDGGAVASGGAGTATGGQAEAGGGGAGSGPSGGAGGAPHDTAYCIAQFPTTMAWTWDKSGTWVSGHGTQGEVTFACAQDPCWTASIQWHPETMWFDEARSKLSVDVTIRSTDGIHLTANGAECVLAVDPEITGTVVFTVQQVSNGYQIMQITDGNLLVYGKGHVTSGTCNSGWPGDWMLITEETEIAFLQTVANRVLPCVR